MPTLKGRSLHLAYPELLKIDNTESGLDNSLRNIEDGMGNPTGIQVGSGMVALFNYPFPSSGFESGRVLRINAENNAFEWHTLSTSDIPNLSSVATSGSYDDLVDTPIFNFDGGNATTDSIFYTLVVIDGGTN